MAMLSVRRKMRSADESSYEVSVQRVLRYDAMMWELC